MPQMAHGGYGTAYQQTIVSSSKSRGVYIVLGLLLGCLGVHNFYAGYNGKGIAQLLISLTFVGLIVTAFWALIEIITVNTDASGMPMS